VKGQAAQKGVIFRRISHRGKSVIFAKKNREKQAKAKIWRILVCCKVGVAPQGFKLGSEAWKRLPHMLDVQWF
jgi:hypothetical protein